MTRIFVTLVATMAAVFLSANPAAHAFEHKLGVVAGFNYTEWDGDDLRYDPEIGFELGATALVPLRDTISLRTGLAYVQKKTSAKTTAGKFEGQFDYIEIPITALYALNETAALFGGVNVDFQVNDECELAGATCTIKNDEAVAYNLVVGGRFNFMKPSAFEAFYELGLGDIAKDTKIGSSLGLRYVYMFD
jgi:hypothetical protein